MHNEMCTLVFYSMDSDYPRSVLGHGGVNVFPNREGRCDNCGLFIRAANAHEPTVSCPRCGSDIDLQGGLSFSDWSSRWGDLGRDCDFISYAARAGNRIAVVPRG